MRHHSRHPSPDRAANKARSLSALETRLRAASRRAAEDGYLQRAASYKQQAAAVRDEKERWSLLANTPPAPSSGPHLFASVLVILLSLFDLSASGAAARRLARAVLTLGLVLCGVILGTSPASAGAQPDVSVPVPWVQQFAAQEYLKTAKDRKIVVGFSRRQAHL